MPAPQRRTTVHFRPRIEELDPRLNPALVANTDTYRAIAGDVLSVPLNRGVLANDFSDIDSGAVLQATLDPGTLVYTDFGTGTTAANVLANPVPVNALTLNADGSFTFIVPTNVPRNAEAISFTYTVFNALNPPTAAGGGEPVATGQVFIDIGRPTPPRVAVGADRGQGPLVNVFTAANGEFVQTFEAYEPSFTGGVRVAVGDFNADGVPDVATAPGFGGSARIKIFDGQTGRLLFDDILFEPTFTGGAYVAAGDVNGDSHTDLIVGAGVGGGPRIVVLNGQSFLPTFIGPSPYAPTVGGVGPGGFVIQADVLMDFFAYEQNYRGGVRVAAGDIDGRGYDYVVTAPGAGGGPVVKQFDYFEVVGPPSVVAGGGGVIRQPISQYGINFGGSAAPTRSFFAGDPADRSGVYVSAGDTTGDGKADIITGQANGAAIVRVFDGQTLGLISQFGVPYEVATATGTGLQTTNNTGAAVAALLPSVLPSGNLLAPTQKPESLVGGDAGPQGLGQPTNGPVREFPGIADGGVRVVAVDVNGDGVAEVVTGAGPGNPPRVRVFGGTGNQLLNFLAMPPGVLNGVNVG